MDDTGLYYYNARYYDPQIGRFISPDSFVQYSTDFNSVSTTLTVNAIPEGLGSVLAPQGSYPLPSVTAPMNPQALNRYSYVLNNPLRYTDPTGWDTLAIGTYLIAGCGFGVEGGGIVVIDDNGNWGVLDYGSIAGTFIGAEAGGGVQFQYTTADTIFALEGPSIQIGGSGTIGTPIGGLNIGAEYVFGLTDEPYQGVNVNVGASINPPAFIYEQHTILTEATVEYMGNSWWIEVLFDILTGQWGEYIDAAMDEAPSLPAEEGNEPDYIPPYDEWW